MENFSKLFPNTQYKLGDRLVLDQEGFRRAHDDIALTMAKTDILMRRKFRLRVRHGD
jgi:hypothetical protein